MKKHNSFWASSATALVLTGMPADAQRIKSGCGSGSMRLVVGFAVAMAFGVAPCLADATEAFIDAGCVPINMTVGMQGEAYILLNCAETKKKWLGQGKKAQADAIKALIICRTAPALYLPMPPAPLKLAWCTAIE